MSNVIETAKELLSSGKVGIIIGYQGENNKTWPVFITKPEDAGKLVFNNYSLNNLSVYLTKKELKANGKIGIFAKPCDVKSIIMLIKENQIKRDEVYIIGMNCGGVVNDFGVDFSKDTIANRCIVCDSKTAEIFDVLLGDQVNFDGLKDEHLEKIKSVDSLAPEEKFDLWEKEFDKCIRCYACRQACPLCYCEKCIADKSVPEWIESSATKRGNFAWNLIRAFHLGGRCVGCNECERACPVDIPLSLLNRKMAIFIKDEFDYVSGRNPDSPTLVGSYNNNDREDFIK